MDFASGPRLGFSGGRVLEPGWAPDCSWPWCPNRFAADPPRRDRGRPVIARIARQLLRTPPPLGGLHPAHPAAASTSPSATRPSPTASCTPTRAAALGPASARLVHRPLHRPAAARRLALRHQPRTIDKEDATPARTWPASPTCSVRCACPKAACARPPAPMSWSTCSCSSAAPDEAPAARLARPGRNGRRKRPRRRRDRRAGGRRRDPQAPATPASPPQRPAGQRVFPRAPGDGAGTACPGAASRSGPDHTSAPPGAGPLEAQLDTALAGPGPRHLHGIALSPASSVAEPPVRPGTAAEGAAVKEGSLLLGPPGRLMQIVEGRPRPGRDPQGKEGSGGIRRGGEDHPRAAPDPRRGAGGAARPGFDRPGRSTR